MSSTMANTIVFHALLGRGDLILSQAEDGGGNYSYHKVAGPGLVGLDVHSLPFVGEAFEIDLDGARALARRLRPRMIVIGGSNVLFPYPVSELKAVANEVGAQLLYDAAHLSVFIANGLLQKPLDEGADLITISTHKAFGGPTGGMILTNDEQSAVRIRTDVHPTFLQSRSQSSYAALAMTLAEHTAHGAAYGRQMILNARALGAAFEAEGFRVVAANRGYTSTHQVYLSFGSVSEAKRAETLCQSANILMAANFLAGDMTRGGRTGGRMSTQEITRQGMKERDVAEIAKFMRRLVIEGNDPKKVAGEVCEFLLPFHRVHFSFD